MTNELKISIQKGTNGEKISLDSITIDAADSLKVFLESLTEIAKQYNDSSNFKISLSEGSVVSSLSYSQDIDNITKDFEDIIHGKSTNYNLIKSFKTIQDKIKLNGLTYSVLLKSTKGTVDLTPKFKGVSFKQPRKVLPVEIHTEFIKGYLYEAGGKRTVNIHIHDDTSEFKVECNKDQVLRLNSSLYKEVYLSAIRKQVGNNIVRIFLDDYSNEREQVKFSGLYRSLHADSIDRFDCLYDFIEECVSVDDIRGLKKVCLLYDHKFTERGILRTILMALKPIINQKEYESILPLYSQIAERLRLGSTNNRI